MPNSLLRVGHLKLLVIRVSRAINSIIENNQNRAVLANSVHYLCNTLN